MRTVPGRTDRVVVVGAGLGGLSAALRLAGAGRQVTVLERESVPGGRCGLLELDGYRFDTGPTVLTMPGLLADALASVGEQVSDWLSLVPLEPAYRSVFPDGSVLDVLTDVDAMADQIHGLCGAAEADGYRRYVQFLRELYRAQVADFIDANLDSPADLLTPNLARLIAMGGLRRMAAVVGRYLHDPRTRRVFSFQALYAGVSPYQALGLYAVIAYMDNVAGVFAPRGGMHAVPVALAAAAVKHGVQIRYGCEVTGVELAGDRARAVTTGTSDRVECDALVLNPDLPVARRLLGRPTRRRVRYSPSCFLLHAGSTVAYPGSAHHTVVFGAQWRQTFDELISRGRLMSDPSLLVSNPTRTDPSLAPTGGHAYNVLAPTPNLAAPIDWAQVGPRYRDELVGVLEQRGYPGFGAGITVESTTTPLQWRQRGMERGTPFAAAHTLTQTGPFRPRNWWGTNVVFTGSGTTPGVGVPMVLISGRLAAERITGPDKGYRSAAWP